MRLRLKLQISLGVKYRLRQWFVISRRQSRIGLAMPLPDFVQTRFFVEPLDEGKNTGEPRGIRGQIGLFDFWSQSRRAVQIESERNILGERFRSIRLTMLLVELAHRGGGFFGFLRLLNGLRDLASNLLAQRIRKPQFFVVSANIYGG